MTMQTFIFHKGAPRGPMIARVAAFLEALATERSWKLEVSLFRKKRSDEQNAYLWGVAYRAILSAGLGEQGWTNEDLHDYCLGEHFGWETITGFGRKRLRPIRRSSKLSTVEFMDFVAFIQRRMAEHGIYVPDPNEDLECAA